MRQLGAYTVQVSSGEVWGMLSAEQPARLSDSKDFRLLSWGKTGNQSWQFLRSDTLPPPLSPGDDVLSTTLLSGVTHFARTEQERGRALFELAGPSLSGSPSLLPLFPSGSSSLLSLSLSSPAEIWQQVTSALPTSKRLVLESNVLTLVASVFGDAVSLEFDVLPLLGEGTTLEIKKTSSGAIAFLLAGSADEEILPGKIDQLHTSFGVSLTTVRVVTRVLENGRFIAQNIRDDATVFEGEGYDNGQWHIRSTVSTQGRKGLFSATMEERFLLSNNEDLLREGMTASLSSPSSPSPQSSTALAQGTFAPTGISALFGDSLPSLLRFFSPSPTPSAFRWSLERRGDVTALSIRPLPSAKN
jgi:hypothetical protein